MLEECSEHVTTKQIKHLNKDTTFKKDISPQIIEDFTPSSPIVNPYILSNNESSNLCKLDTNKNFCQPKIKKSKTIIPFRPFESILSTENCIDKLRLIMNDRRPLAEIASEMGL